MSSNNPDGPSLPVQNQMNCCNCDQKSEIEAQFHSCPNGHTLSICAKCSETKISCPICKAPLDKIKTEAEDHNQAGTSGGSNVGKENEDSNGLKGGTGDADRNSKKRKHDDSAEAEDSQDDIIQSDEKEIVFLVKAGQTIKIINDADNSSISVTKKPGLEFSIITSTSTSENKTSRISFSFAPNEISKISCSSVSNLETISGGAPVANSSPVPATFQITPPAYACGNMGICNSSTGTFQTQTQTQTQTVPPPFNSICTFGNVGMGYNSSSPAIQTVPSVFTYVNGSSGGFFGGGGGNSGPSVYDRGATIWRTNSTFTANGAIINGSNNTITGNGNVINGSNNRIAGNTNKVNGSNNQILGNSNEIFGSNNILRGFGNRATGFNNQ